MIRKTVVKTAFAIAASALLIGCSSGPSESDVRKALERSLESMNSELREALGNSARVEAFELTDFDLLGCEEAGESYSCDVVMSMDTPLMKVSDRSTTLRVRKGGGGWRVIGGLQ